MAVRINLIIILTCFAYCCVSRPPVDKNRQPDNPTDNHVNVNNNTHTKEEEGPQDWMQLEYQRYLEEVVKELETDVDFKAKLEKADPDHIKSGKIADELDLVGHGVRSKLDEAKRREVQRLKELLEKKTKMGDHSLDGFSIEHLDAADVNAFSAEDLRKLIKQTTKDLEDIDTKRRGEFKEYELKKQAKFDLELEKMTPEERVQAKAAHEAEIKKHKDHEKINHPGGKEQLKEVWEEQDHLDKDSFDMNTFFNLHDLNADGYLEPDELEALFQVELDKVYNKSNSEDDMVERNEELNRMREHVQSEIDKDKDGLISKDEFLNEAQDPDFDKNESWESIGEGDPVFSDEELRLEEEELRREMQMNTPPHERQPDQALPAQPPHA